MLVPFHLASPCLDFIISWTTRNLRYEVSVNLRAISLKFTEMDH